MRAAKALLLATAVLPLAGCLSPQSSTPEQFERGLIMLLTGVECQACYHTGCVKGLREGGVDCAISLEEWGTKPFGTFPNLRSYELNRERAAQLATKVVAYHEQRCTAPITLIGYSGGGAMALFIAEALPDNLKLDRIIMTSPAISPRYDLSKAMAHCRRGIISFYSPEDWFMSGWATRTWGTMDRVKTDTAGRIGFRDADDELLRLDGFEQICWRPAWRELGHWGGHVGWRAQGFAREILAPQVRTAASRPT